MEATARINQVVTFMLQGEEMAIPIQKVQEVIRLPEITRVPMASDIVHGLGNLRGDILPVVNLRRRLGLEEKVQDEATRVVVLNIGGVPTGVVVDSVSEVVTLETDCLQEPPSTVSGIGGQYLTSIAKLDGGKRLVLILNEGKVLPESERMEAVKAQQDANQSRQQTAVFEETEQVVTFVVGEEEYGIDIMRVQEIIKVTDITPVPKAPDYVVGVMSLRNRLLPIMDLRSRFGGPAPAEDENIANKRVAVVDFNGTQIGIQVDSVSQVLTLQKKQIENPPNIVRSGNADCLKGVGKLDGGKRLIMMLDVAKLLKGDEFKDLDAKAQEVQHAAQAKAEASDESQLVCFKINREEYAIDIMKVQEIIRLREITTVPHSKTYMEGIINLRGTVVPVVDMRARFGLAKAEHSENNRIVVVKIDGHITGLIVDSVSEVLRMPKALIEAAPASVSGVGDEFIDGVGKLDNGKRILVLVRVEALLVESH